MFKDRKNYPRIFLAVLSFLGMATMGYLVSLHYAPEAGSFCNLGEGLSCEIVNKSLYAKIFGIPVSLLGFLYFASVFVCAIWRSYNAIFKKLLFLSIVFLGPSIYLTLVEFFILENVCILCEFSKLLIVAIIVVLLWALRPVKFSVYFFGSAILLAIVSGLIMYSVYARAIPSEKYRPFAACLYTEGFRMYGAKSCAFCARQRALFGDAFEEIHEIECDPRYADHQVERCIAKDITRTPTWIIEDAAGSDIRRFDPGVLSLEELSVASGCELP